MALQPRRGPVCHRDHGYLDVVTVCDASLSRWTVGHSLFPLRGSGHRPRAALVRVQAYHSTSRRTAFIDCHHLSHDGGVQDFRHRFHYGESGGNRAGFDQTL